MITIFAILTLSFGYGTVDLLAFRARLARRT